MKLYQYNASYWRRLLAFIVDIILCDLFLFSVWDILLIKKIGADYSSLYNALINDSGLLVLFYLILGCMTILLLAYFTIFTILCRQTPGMMLFKIRVVSLTDDLSVGQVFVRNLILIPFFPFSLLWIIDPIHLFFSGQGQRWTEKLSKTKIVQNYVLKE